MAIVRREAAAGVSAALLHLADACCAAGVAVPPVLPAGKGPRNFALDRDKQLAGVRQRAEIIQLPPTTPALADRTWVLLTGAPEGGWGLGGHADTNAGLVSAAGYRPCRYLPVPPESRQLRYFDAAPRALAASRPFSGANPGSRLAVGVTEVPGFGVADVRACRVEETTQRDLWKSLVSGAFVCCGWRAGKGDHVA
jgi:hypothetical protein